MAKSASSFGRFAGPCPSCKSKDAQGRGKCPKCGAFAKGDGSAWFKKGIKEPIEPVSEPVKEPVKIAVKTPTVSPSKKRSPLNEAKEPVKSPSKARVEPVTEPVRARSSITDIFDIF